MYGKVRKGPKCSRNKHGEPKPNDILISVHGPLAQKLLRPHHLQWALHLTKVFSSFLSMLLYNPQ